MGCVSTTCRASRAWQSLIDAGRGDPRGDRPRLRAEGMVGIYQWPSPTAGESHFAFCGRWACDGGAELDAGIVRAIWMTLDEIRASQARHRTRWSVAVHRDFLAGRRFGLSCSVGTIGNLNMFGRVLPPVCCSRRRCMPPKVAICFNYGCPGEAKISFAEP